MRRGIVTLVLLALSVAGAWSVAPPVRQAPFTDEEAAWLAKLAGRIAEHGKAGRFEEVVKLCKQEVALRQRAQGRTHWQTLDARRQLEDWRRLEDVSQEDRADVWRSIELDERGGALAARGRWRDAERSYREALDLRLRALGAAHVGTASAYGEVARCLEQQGKLAEALALHQKALAVTHKALSRQWARLW